MNIPPDAGKFWFTLAIGLVLLTGALMFVVEPGTASYYINAFTLIAALILLVLVIVLVRLSNK